MENLWTPEQRAERHQAWLETWGLSADDWRRVHLAADEVTPNHTPYALVDLSVPVRIVVWLAAHKHPPVGTNLGVIRRDEGDVLVIAWQMNERETATWAKARR